MLAAAESLIFVLHCVIPPERVYSGGELLAFVHLETCFVSADIDSRVLRDNQCYRVSTGILIWHCDTQSK